MKQHVLLPSLAALALLPAITTEVRAGTLFFDFGETTQQTPGNYNNVFVGGGTNSLAVPNAVDNTGAPTGLGLLAAGFNPGSNQNGTTAPTGAAAIFDPQATRDNMFGHTGSFGGITRPLGVLSLSGLDASGNTSYAFTFFGSRTGVSDNRETKYEALGGNTGFALLNTANNTSEVALLGGIFPDALGNLTINVSPGPNNNNASGFFYLGALKIETTVIPEPSSAGLCALGVLALALCRRGRSA
jgi:hypothetical protein